MIFGIVLFWLSLPRWVREPVRVIFLAALIVLVAMLAALVLLPQGW